MYILHDTDNKLTTSQVDNHPLFPVRFYDANSLFNLESRRSALEEETNKFSPRNKCLLVADFYRSLSTKDIDRIWPLYTYFYNNDLLHFLTRMNYHHLFIYTIRSRASQKNLNRLTALVDDMKRRGFSLKLSEYNALIDWVGGKTVPHKHSHHLTEALKLLEEMQQPYLLNAEGEKVPKKPVQPSVDTFNILIHIAARLSDLRTAQKLYHDMISRGIEPDKYTYCTLIHAMGEFGDVNGMDTIIKEMKQHRVTKNTVIWNAIMSGYAKNGLKDRAYTMFKQMSRANNKKHIPKADAESFRIYIDLLLTDDKRTEAILTLDKMQRLNIRPIVTIYNSLFASFTKPTDNSFDYLFEIEEPVEDASNQLDTLRQLYQQMKDVQVKPNSETMYTLVSAFLDLGDTKSALEAFVFLSENKSTISKSVQNNTISSLLQSNRFIKEEKMEPQKIEPSPELLERLNTIVAKKAV